MQPWQLKDNFLSSCSTSNNSLQNIQSLLEFTSWQEFISSTVVEANRCRTPLQYNFFPNQWVQILCIYFKICKISSISLAIWILNYIIINTHIFQIKNQAFVPIHVYQHPREMQVICLQSSLVFFQNLKQCRNTFTLMFLRGLDGPGHFQTVLISFGRKALYEDIGK